MFEPVTVIHRNTDALPSLKAKSENLSNLSVGQFEPFSSHRAARTKLSRLTVYFCVLTVVYSHNDNTACVIILEMIVCFVKSFL